MSAQIAFSIGQRVRDAKRLEQIRGTFDDLVARVRSDGHTAKDGPYICGPMRNGRRGAATALPVAFAALDLDAIPDAAALEAIVEAARRWRCCVYTTFSHKPAEGIFKARILFELDREVSRDEYPRACAALAAELQQAAGVLVVIDESCSKPEQPLFTARDGSQVWDHPGEPVCVDSLAEAFGQRTQPQTAPTPVPEGAEADPFFGAPPSAAVEREVRSALAYLDPDPYELWIKTGHALKSLGETGRKLWHEWSGRSDKYDCETAEVKWASFKPERTGYAAIFAEAQRQGWVNPRAGIARGARPGEVLDVTAAGFDAADAPRLLDLTALAQRAPAQPAFLVPNWLPAGEVTMLSGHGGTGKSSVALRLGISIALGREWYELPVEQRGVDYISFEDSEPVIHWRLQKLCEASGVSLVDLAPHMRVFDGTQCLHGWYSRRQYGETGPTAAFHEIAEHVGGPGRVVIVDGASDTFAANENDRAQVKAFLRTLRRLVSPDGALLLLAHVDKLAAKSGAESLGFSGSTGWHNGVRCRWYMFAEADSHENETGNLILEVRKNNFGYAGGRLVLSFNEFTDTFERVDPNAPHRSNTAQSTGEAEAIVRVIRQTWAAGNPIPAATSGTRTAYSVAEAYESLPESLRGRRGRQRFYKVLEKLRAAGTVRIEPFKRSNRHATEVLHAPE